jgi:ABC-type phosphate transport system substrate-binding protein
MRKLFLSSVLAVMAGIAGSAQAEVVVVVNSSAAVTSLTKEQVAQYFLGKAGEFTPLDQPESAAIRSEFYQKVANKDLAQTRALWSKLVFTGKAMPPKEVASNAEVKKAVAANPKAIGYIDKSAVDATVKVICTLP